MRIRLRLLVIQLSYARQMYHLVLGKINLTGLCITIYKRIVLKNNIQTVTEDICRYKFRKNGYISVGCISYLLT